MVKCPIKSIYSSLTSSCSALLYHIHSNQLAHNLATTVSYSSNQLAKLAQIWWYEFDMRCMKDRFQTPCKQVHWPHTVYTHHNNLGIHSCVWQVAVRQCCETLIPSIQFPSITVCDGATVVHSCSVSSSWLSLVIMVASWLDVIGDQRHLTWEGFTLRGKSFSP